MKAKYQQIADELRFKIVNGDYPQGAVIPPEMKLQEMYQVSRHTIRQAIALLANEGYLRKEKGSGTYVDQPAVPNTGTRRKTIGVITTYLSDYIFPSIIRGIEAVLRDNNYSLLLASTSNDPEQERKCLESMRNQGVDGLIVEPTKSNLYNPNLSYYLQFKEAGIPVVMLNAGYETLDLPVIRLDDVRAGFLATDYLLKQGHQELALITKMDDIQGKLRMKGFIEAHEAAGLSFDSSNIYTYTTESKTEVIQTASVQLLTTSVTGVVCYNDEVANSLVQILSDKKAIPQELAVIGQDDSYLSTAGEIPLTTVSHPKEQMGRAAAEWMLKAIETNEQPADIIYEPKVIPRTSA